MPSPLGIKGIPCGSLNCAGNLRRILSMCLVMAWCGHSLWKCLADLHDVLWRRRHQHCLSSGLVMLGRWFVLWLLFGARHVRWLLPRSLSATTSSRSVWHRSWLLGLRLYGQMPHSSSISKESLNGVGPIPRTMDLVVFFISCCKK